MKFKNVTVTHGPNEKGKDLIFYSDGPMGEQLLCACVVKNSAITGDQSLRGTKSILNQAEQALDEPYVSSTGSRERVNRVYVVSPYQPSTFALENIQGRLERSGQIEFICGSGLLRLFEEHWPEFLFFESNIFSSYLVSLRNEAEHDTALESIFLRERLSPKAVGLSSIYVDQRLEFRLSLFDAKRLVLPTISNLAQRVSRKWLSAVRADVGRAIQLSDYAHLWVDESPMLGRIKAAASRLTKDGIDALELEWQKANDSGLGGRVAEAARNARFVAMQKIDPDALAKVKLTSSLKACLADVDVLCELLDSFYSFVDSTNQKVANIDLSESGFHAELDPYLQYCALERICEAIPSIMSRRGGGSRSMFANVDHVFKITAVGLVTAPAGWGKTSLCRWLVLRDLDRLLAGEHDAIPVFVRLHRFRGTEELEFDQAFLPTPELREYLNKSTGANVHLYLDGLDEVADPGKRDAIIRAMQHGLRRYRGLRVMVTARDYVWSDWITEVPRIRLESFRDHQIHELIKKWLRDETVIEEFYRQQLAVPGLKQIMTVPLLATLTVSVFIQTQKLPRTRNRLYRSFVDLLGGGWDVAKLVDRKSRFQTEEKLLVLGTVAYAMHKDRLREFSEDAFREAVRVTLEFYETQWVEMMREILEDGLLVSEGSDLMFPHFSLQEYFCACHVYDPTTGRQKEVLLYFLEGDEWWREVVVFMIGMTTRPRHMEAWIMEQSSGLPRWAKERDQVRGRCETLVAALRDAFPGYHRSWEG